MEGPGANEDGSQGLLALRPQLQGSGAGSPQARNLDSRYRLTF